MPVLMDQDEPDCVSVVRPNQRPGLDLHPNLGQQQVTEFMTHHSSSTSMIRNPTTTPTTADDV